MEVKCIHFVLAGEAGNSDFNILRISDTKNTEDAEAAKKTEDVEAAKNTEVVEEAKNTEPAEDPKTESAEEAKKVIEETKNTEVLEEAKNTEVVAEAMNTKVVEEAKNTKVVEEAKNTEVLEEAKNTEVVAEAKNTKVIEEAKNTEVLEEAKNTEVLEEAKNTEVVAEAKNTKVVEEAKNTKVVEEAKNTEVSEEAKETEVVEVAKNIELVEVVDDAKKRDAPAGNDMKIEVDFYHMKGNRSCKAVNGEAQISYTATVYGVNGTNATHYVFEGYQFPTNKMVTQGFFHQTTSTTSNPPKFFTDKVITEGTALPGSEDVFKKDWPIELYVILGEDNVVARDESTYNESQISTALKRKRAADPCKQASEPGFFHFNTLDDLPRSIEKNKYAIHGYFHTSLDVNPTKLPLSTLQIPRYFDHEDHTDELIIQNYRDTVHVSHDSKPAYITTFKERQYIKASIVHQNNFIYKRDASAANQPATNSSQSETGTKMEGYFHIPGNLILDVDTNSNTVYEAKYELKKKAGASDIMHILASFITKSRGDEFKGYLEHAASSAEGTPINKFTLDLNLVVADFNTVATVLMPNYTESGTVNEENVPQVKNPTTTTSPPQKPAKRQAHLENRKQRRRAYNYENDVSLKLGLDKDSDSKTRRRHAEMRPAGEEKQAPYANSKRKRQAGLNSRRRLRRQEDFDGDADDIISTLVDNDVVRNIQRRGTNGGGTMKKTVIIPGYFHIPCNITIDVDKGIVQSVTNFEFYVEKEGTYSIKNGIFHDKSKLAKWLDKENVHGWLKPNKKDYEVPFYFKHYDHWDFLNIPGYEPPTNMSQPSYLTVSNEADNSAYIGVYIKHGNQDADHMPFEDPFKTTTTTRKPAASVLWKKYPPTPSHDNPPPKAPTLAAATNGAHFVRSSTSMTLLSMAMTFRLFAIATGFK
jgi:hypothetical protein